MSHILTHFHDRYLESTNSISDGSFDGLSIQDNFRILMDRLAFSQRNCFSSRTFPSDDESNACWIPCQSLLPHCYRFVMFTNSFLFVPVLTVLPSIRANHSGDDFHSCVTSSKTFFIHDKSLLPDAVTRTVLSTERIEDDFLQLSAVVLFPHFPFKGMVHKILI